MNEHEKALPAGGPAKPTQNAVKIYVISSRERLYSKISTFATENSILYILNVLFSYYFAQNYEENLDRKLNTSRLLEQERRTTSPDLLEQKKEQET